jgi:hypothetical protein
VGTPINGSKCFVATEIVDVGYLRNRFDKNPDAEPMRSLVIRGFIAVDGEPIAIATDVKISYAKSANLLRWVTAGRDGKKPGDDEEVDPGEFAGVPIMVTVESQARDGTSEYWLRMKDPAPMPDEMNVPDCLTQYLMADPPPFAWKSEADVADHRERIMALQRGEVGDAPGRPPHPAQGEERGNERGQTAATAALDEAWKEANKIYQAAAGAAIKKAGFDRETSAADQQVALDHFWSLFEQYPKIYAARNERGGFNVNPGNHNPDELREAADILRRFVAGEELTDEDRAAREADEPFPADEDEGLPV